MVNIQYLDGWTAEIFIDYFRFFILFANFYTLLYNLRTFYAKGIPQIAIKANITNTDRRYNDSKSLRPGGCNKLQATAMVIDITDKRCKTMKTERGTFDRHEVPHSIASKVMSKVQIKLHAETKSLVGSVTRADKYPQARTRTTDCIIYVIGGGGYLKEGNSAPGYGATDDKSPQIYLPLLLDSG